MSRAQTRALLRAIEGIDSAGGGESCFQVLTQGSDVDTPASITWFHDNMAGTERAVTQAAGPVRIFGFYIGNRDVNTYEVRLKNGGEICYSTILPGTGSGGYVAQTFAPPLIFSTDPFIEKDDTGNMRFLLIHHPT